MKIGFMGGSFDPVHFGHLVAAQDAYEQHGLGRVVFVPAAQAPLKPGQTRISGADRCAMVQAVIEGDGRFSLSDFEVSKGGVSYTIDSARHFRTLYPEDELFWIIGSDQLATLHLWKDIDELMTLVEFILLERPGFPSEAALPATDLKLRRCQGHLIEVSSTELRNRAARGLSLEYFIPSKAIVYIENHCLYR